MVLRNIQRILLSGSLAIAGGAASLPETRPSPDAPVAVTHALSTGGWLEALTKLDYGIADFRRGIADGSVSTLYARLVNDRQSLQTLQTLVKDKDMVKAASDNVSRTMSAIRAFYADYIRQPWLGDESAYRSPDVIVILGANQPRLDQRLVHALPIIQRFKDVPVILSGGGRTIASEAQTMHDFLVGHGVAGDRMIMEQDSLDTIGNAVFSGLAMRKKGMEGGNVLLVTSDFHAPRALFLFRSVLGPRFRVAVSSAPSPGTDVAMRIESELQQEALAIQDVLHWPSIAEEPPMPVEGVCGVFYQLLLRHKLYESRWDLARRHADECKLPEQAFTPDE
ncbi:YdcF family protein [Brucella sp. IR073]|uniref:YdcF family protein n=1 Tax=unclassified Brucella TaxID=2632610 RepID=UPI003B981FFC